MNWKNKLAGILVILGPIYSQAQELKEFKWLAGTWKQKDKNAYEVWTDKGNFLEGKSFIIGSSADTTVTESIRLISKEGAFFYVPDVEGPQGEVYFKISSLDGSGFVASNPDHDFPKIITYARVGKSLLEATIEGNGKKKTFYFERLN
ncbi:MAG: DUF6265 family protein [Flammeovirgaceae bacterium]|nr:DUF6265 family protein [Flammeovirgaceae bacterium]